MRIADRSFEKSEKGILTVTAACLQYASIDFAFTNSPSIGDWAYEDVFCMAATSEIAGSNDLSF